MTHFFQKMGKQEQQQQQVDELCIGCGGQDSFEMVRERWCMKKRKREGREGRYLHCDSSEKRARNVSAELG